MNLSKVDNPFLSPYPLNPKGDIVPLKKIDDRHYTELSEKESPDKVGESFAEVFKKAHEQVNDLQVNANSLTQKMVYDPNSVDVHELMIASEKARISLTFTKTIADGVVKAYRELTNLR